MFDVVEHLYRSLDTRATPEAVAALIYDGMGSRFMPPERRVLVRAAHSRPASYSSMSDDFERPVPATHKVRMLATLLDVEMSDQAVTEMAEDPWKLLGQLRIAGQYAGWHPDADFACRLNREQRAHYGLMPSKRKYNRLVRHMQRTQARAKRLQQQILLRQLTLVGRSGLAYTITREEMDADPSAAAFVAYWVAQRNRRRAFSLGGRDNPFDTIAQLLLDHCVRRPGTDWWMIARAYPHPEVVARLTDDRLGELLGRWSGFMRLGAEMLREQYATWPTRDIPPVVPDSMWAARPGLMPTPAARGARTVCVVDRETMIVQRGVDSSTWNTVAQAYNAARAGWINVLGAAGLLDLLEVMCPPKAMRLMAADLAYWHQRQRGGGLDPDTAVWAGLPPPWDVLDGRVPCDALDVEDLCRRLGVDPHAKGWTAPRQVGQVAEWKPTPELVHGVEIADPLWAGLLRKAGVFSGKDPKAEAAGLMAAYAQDTAKYGGNA